MSHKTATFLPKPQRLMSIAQLCMAFSLLLWHATQPFMGEYFALRSRMLLYEYVMGSSSALKSKPNGQARLERQGLRFEQLPDKNKLISDYQQLKNYANRPLLEKIEGGIRRVISQVPPFEQAWIFFSIVISILILLKWEGAKQAVWLLPFIVIAYAADNIETGKPAKQQPDAVLFPSEKAIVQNYIAEPLGPTTQIQQEQLESGWKRYLIKNWSSTLTGDEDQKLENAEYNFTLARLRLLRAQPRYEWLQSPHERVSATSLMFFLLWNGCFAWIVSRPSQVKSLNTPIPAK